MNTPLITWGLIVGLFIAILLVRLYRAASSHSKNKESLVSFLKEREEFYIPGDPNPRETDEYDYEYFEDI